MSNVEHHVALSVSLLMRLHSSPVLSPFACPASRCGPSKREGSACSSREIAFPQEPRHPARRSHLWQGRLVHSALSSLRLVRHAPSQFVVGASRRSAAPGSQGFERCRVRHRYARLYAQSCSTLRHMASPWHPGNTEAAPSVMPNLSIERTRPGKPGRASHVKR
jgi:hypothetical protein